MRNELPTMMTLQDIADYHNVSIEDASALSKVWPVVGTYFPPKGRAVALWSTLDVADKCRDGHLLPVPGMECRTCKFLQRIG